MERVYDLFGVKGVEIYWGRSKRGRNDRCVETVASLRVAGSMCWVFSHLSALVDHWTQVGGCRSAMAVRGRGCTVLSSYRVRRILTKVTSSKFVVVKPSAPQPYPSSWEAPASMRWQIVGRFCLVYRGLACRTLQKLANM